MVKLTTEQRVLHGRILYVNAKCNHRIGNEQ